MFYQFNHEKCREFDDNFRVVGIERYRFAILIFGLDEIFGRCKLPGAYQVGACSLIDCKNDFMKRRRKKTTWKGVGKKRKFVWTEGGYGNIPPIFFPVLRLFHCFHRYQLSIFKHTSDDGTRNGFNIFASFTDVPIGWKRTLEFEIATIRFSLRIFFDPSSVWDIMVKVKFYV